MTPCVRWYELKKPRLAKIHHTLQITLSDYFAFIQNLQRLYMVVFLSPDKPLGQPSVSASKVYLNQHTVTQLTNEFSNLNYVLVFQTVNNTVKGCYVQYAFWYDVFRISYKTNNI